MKNCPTCGGPSRQKFAKKGDVEAGGDVSDNPSIATTEDTATDDPSAAPAASAAPAQAVDDSSPVQTTDGSQPSAAEDAVSDLPPSPSADATPAAAPDTSGPGSVSGNTVTVLGKNQELPPPTPPSAPGAADMAVEHALIQKDVLDQKISPKTYNDLLWKDKSVPGKLGSLFGLMLSGMGSGLTGQPNMLMEMMNRTIENDLNAQKSTKEGNRNLYQLNLQHQMNLAQQQKDYYDSYLANETAKLKPAERKLLLAQASQANATRDKTAAETAGVVTKNQMLEWVKNHFTGMTTNMSGPNQQNGQNILNNYIKPGFDQQIQGNITNGAGKTGLMQQMTPYPVIPGGGPVMGGQDNGQESNELPPDQPVANNELLNALSMEGSPFPKDTVAKSRDQAAEVQNIRDVKKMYYKAYDALNTPEAGQMGEAASRGIKTLGGLATKVLEAGMTLANPKTAILNALGSQASDKALSGAAEDVLKFQQFRKAQMGTVLPMMSRLTTGQFQSGESQYQEDSLFPTIYDMGDEDTRKAKFNNGMSLLDAEERKHSGVLDSIPGARISNSPVYKYPAMHADKKKKEEPTPPGLTPLDMSQQPLD